MSSEKPSNHPLRAVRHARGLNQLELAKKSGVSARTIYSIETEEGVPKQETCRRLLRALDGQFTPERRIEVFGPLPPRPLKRYRPRKKLQL